MRLTSALHLRQLIAKLHPPLPTTRRESQQLLSVLQSSFKRSLDEIHPSPQSAELVNFSVPSSAPSTLRKTSADATNLHLQAILNHPLLEQKSAFSQPPRSSIEKALALFNNSVLQNEVTHSIVERCVGIYQHGRKHGDIVQGNAKLGSKIALWFSSLTSQRREEFLTDRRLMSKVIPLMYIDGLEEVVWDWLRTLYQGDLSVDNPLSKYNARSFAWLDIEDSFVSFMVRESLRRNNFNTAVQEFVQACHYRTKSGRASVVSEQEHPELTYRPLYSSWRLITSAILCRRHTHGISLASYDQLLALNIPWSYATTVDQAFLNLYRPSSPAMENLYQRLRKQEDLDKFLSWKSTCSERLQKALLVSIIDAAELALNEERQGALYFFLSLTEDYFPDLVSSGLASDISTRIGHVREEVKAHMFSSPSLAVP